MRRMQRNEERYTLDPTFESTQGILSGAVHSNSNSSAYLEPGVPARENKCKIVPLESDKALVIITCDIQLSSPMIFCWIAPSLTDTPYFEDMQSRFRRGRSIPAQERMRCTNFMVKDCKWLPTYN
jgi:hypothetical protein